MYSEGVPGLIFVFIVWLAVTLVSGQPDIECCQNDLCPISCVRCDGIPQCFDLSDELGCEASRDQHLLAYKKPPIFVDPVLKVIKDQLMREKTEKAHLYPGKVCFKPPQTTTTETPIWKLLWERLLEEQERRAAQTTTPTTTTTTTTTSKSQIVTDKSLWLEVIEILKAHVSTPAPTTTPLPDTPLWKLIAEKLGPPPTKNVQLTTIPAAPVNNFQWIKTTVSPWFDPRTQGWFGIWGPTTTIPPVKQSTSSISSDHLSVLYDLLVGLTTPKPNVTSTHAPLATSSFTANVTKPTEHLSTLAKTYTTEQPTQEPDVTTVVSTKQTSPTTEATTTNVQLTDATTVVPTDSTTVKSVFLDTQRTVTAIPTDSTTVKPTFLDTQRTVTALPTDSTTTPVSTDPVTSTMASPTYITTENVDVILDALFKSLIKTENKTTGVLDFNNTSTLNNVLSSIDNATFVTLNEDSKASITVQETVNASNFAEVITVNNETINHLNTIWSETDVYQNKTTILNNTYTSNTVSSEVKTDKTVKQLIVSPHTNDGTFETVMRQTTAVPKPEALLTNEVDTTYFVNVTNEGDSVKGNVDFNPLIDTNKDITNILKGLMSTKDYSIRDSPSTTTDLPHNSPTKDQAAAVQTATKNIVPHVEPKVSLNQVQVIPAARISLDAVKPGITPAPVLGVNRYVTPVPWIGQTSIDGIFSNFWDQPAPSTVSDWLFGGPTTSSYDWNLFGTTVASVNSFMNDLFGIPYQNNSPEETITNRVSAVPVAAVRRPATDRVDLFKATNMQLTQRSPTVVTEKTPKPSIRVSVYTSKPTIIPTTPIMQEFSDIIHTSKDVVPGTANTVGVQTTLSPIDISANKPNQVYVAIPKDNSIFDITTMDSVKRSRNVSNFTNSTMSNDTLVEDKIPEFNITTISFESVNASLSQNASTSTNSSMLNETLVVDHTNEYTTSTISFESVNSSLSQNASILTNSDMINETFIENETNEFKTTTASFESVNASITQTTSILTNPTMTNEALVTDHIHKFNTTTASFDSVNTSYIDKTSGHSSYTTETAPTEIYRDYATTPTSPFQSTSTEIMVEKMKEEMAAVIDLGTNETFNTTTISTTTTLAPVVTSFVVPIYTPHSTIPVKKQEDRGMIHNSAIMSWWSKIQKRPTPAPVPKTTKTSIINDREASHCMVLIDDIGFCLTRAGHYKNPSDCRTYFVCDWGTLFQCSCPSNTMFDGKLKVCNWDYAVTC